MPSGFCTLFLFATVVAGKADNREVLFRDGILGVKHYYSTIHYYQNLAGID
jgi:hypothetical protein